MKAKRLLVIEPALVHFSMHPSMFMRGFTAYRVARQPGDGHRHEEEEKLIIEKLKLSYET
jgi:hypothetical protein